MSFWSRKGEPESTVRSAPVVQQNIPGKSEGFGKARKPLSQ
ncbi:hypothetical protein HMPREF3213_03733 [Heyndrickxia coagulans]|uniref:Uncharacterized protein n=1 Tax=Heyndrickxia coagulans TaxID=1398 RepID=A0A0C5C812_HEYCO|nr:hypothetical protein SB48_HM08orf05884 [Heyndrickxia coagulans]KWZ76558.1 hypothetical protein HMPREF3213_03733 [Heyndrickxia coagulans]